MSNARDANVGKAIFLLNHYAPVSQFTIDARKAVEDLLEEVQDLRKLVSDKRI